MMSANLLCCLNTEEGVYIEITSSICPSVLSACPILFGRGYSEGLRNQNMTISTMSSKLLVRFATRFGLLVQHQKPECPVQMCDYCVEG